MDRTIHMGLSRGNTHGACMWDVTKWVGQMRVGAILKGHVCRWLAWIGQMRVGAIHMGHVCGRLASC